MDVRGAMSESYAKVLILMSGFGHLDLDPFFLLI